MQSRFQFGSIFGKYHCVYIKAEWDGRISQFINTFIGIKTAGHPYFIHIFAERPNI